MAINCYCGLQGSGKSYEVVSGPVLDAILAGRNVVTNIDGIHEERIHAYLIAKRQADQMRLGRVVHVTNDRIMEPGFFPDQEKPEQASVVQPGDLCALDEVWRFWGDGVKLSHEHMQFFRMHRHYVNPQTKVCCDVCLMTQDITGITRSLRNVIEFSFRMVKLKKIGFTKNYRVEVYEGWKQNQKTQTQYFVKRYNPDIFPLYSSYAGGVGTEKSIDKRENVLANKKVWALGVIVIALGVVSVSGLRYAWQSLAGAKGDTTQAKEDKEQGGKTLAPESQKAASVAPSSPPKSGASESLRIAGEVQFFGTRWVLLVDQKGTARLENPHAFVGRGMTLVGSVAGERVTTFTGGQKTAPSIVSALPGQGGAK